MYAMAFNLYSSFSLHSLFRYLCLQYECMLYVGRGDGIWDTIQHSSQAIRAAWWWFLGNDEWQESTLNEHLWWPRRDRELRFEGRKRGESFQGGFNFKQCNARPPPLKEAMQEFTICFYHYVHIESSIQTRVFPLDDGLWWLTTVAILLPNYGMMNSHT